MVQASIHPRFLDSQDIQRFLNHTKQCAIPAGITTDCARPLFSDVETDITELCSRLEFLESDSQVESLLSGRDRTLLCVVEEPLDVLAVEKTGVYRGLYHVLHGAISPIEDIGPEDIKIAQLLDRVQLGGINEVIVATNPTLEGDATAMYLQKQMALYPLTISRLARGLPVGGDLEYVDEVTLVRALQGRSEM